MALEFGTPEEQYAYGYRAAMSLLGTWPGTKDLRELFRGDFCLDAYACGCCKRPFQGREPVAWTYAGGFAECLRDAHRWALAKARSGNYEDAHCVAVFLVELGTKLSDYSNKITALVSIEALRRGEVAPLLPCEEPAPLPVDEEATERPARMSA